MSIDLKIVTLKLAIAKNSLIPFIWPLVQPSIDGRSSPWHTSAFEAALRSETNWVRVVSDKAAGQYLPLVASGDLPEPIWPDDLVMFDYIRMAFRRRFIRSINHPTLKRLRGEI